MKSYNSLQTRIIFSIALIVFVSLSIMSFLTGFLIQKEFRIAMEETSLSILESTLIHIENLHRSINYYETSMISRRKIEIRNNTHIAYSILENSFNHVKNGRFSEQEAIDYAVSCIRNLKYQPDGGYFWLTDTSDPYPRMIMHPYLTELEGEIMDSPVFNTALGKEANLFKAFRDVGTISGEGYVDYKWPKPDSDNPETLYPKLGFVKYFAPWDIIIGSGVYLDDIEADIKNRMLSFVRDLNQLILKQKIGENGYIFIFDNEYRVLVHPDIAGTDGRNLLNPSTGNYKMDDLIYAAHNSPDGYIEYLWEKKGFEGDFTFRKKAYTTYYEPLGWYICSTSYFDDFELRASVFRKSVIMISAVFIIFAIIIAFFISHNITQSLSMVVGSIKKTDRSGIPLEYIPDSRYVEIHLLSQTINNMLDSIRTSSSELQDQRDFSLGIVDGAPYIIITLNSKGRIIFVNSKTLEISGYEQEELAGKDLLKMFFLKNGRNIMNSILSGPGTEDIRDREINFKTKSGKKKTVLWNTLTRKKENGEILELILFGNDISERRKTEIALEKSEKRAQLLLSIIPDLLFIVNREGIFLDYEANNREFFISGDFRNRSIVDLLPSEVSAIAMKNIKLALDTGQLREFVYTLPSKKSGRQYYEARMIPSGENEIFLIVRDVTDKSKMEEMMIQSEKMVSVGGLAAGMAHEINNPLAGMLQTAGVLSSRLTNSNLPVNVKAAESCGTTMESINAFMKERGVFKMLKNISESGVRIAKIVDNMLSFARKSDDRTSSHNIPELLDKTVDLAATDFDLKKHYDFRKIKIKREYAPDITSIPCQPGKIQQVFLNLLSNAAHALQESGTENPEITLRIKTDKENNKAIIEIEDNGPGMNEYVRKRIFEPFFTTKPVGTGTGLGLSVSYFIIRDNHGGDMNVESFPGKGTKIIVSLPFDTVETDK